MTPTADAGQTLSIAVCTKFTPDVSQVKADPATGRPDLARAPYRINNFDENAIEEAVRLKEQHGGRVVAISLIDHEPPRDVVLRALAMGVDALYLVTHAAAASGDAFATATILAAAIREIGAVYEMHPWDVILCGEASVDEYNGQVGPRIAEALGIVPITYVTRLEVVGGTVVAHRTIEDYVHVVEATVPALVTVGMETNQPRLPTVLQIMGAGRKPIVHLPLADLERAGLEIPRPALEVRSIFAPPSSRKRVRIEGDDPDDTARKLVRQLQAAGEVTL
ncbi:MAG TPA: electron transfer flavoprotein subunit beta/FixA family protein [Longimicrobiales bacterium]|nr:electron transfer flavoprotein subunit beta/FixA family protein [Longimicrobiales bacterium]